MTDYTYTSLRGNEIRLLQLLPGNFDDKLHFRIIHQDLDSPLPSQSSARLSVEAVQATLPDGWTVFQTPEGRFFFESHITLDIQYQHPDSSVRPELYELPKSSSLQKGQPIYSALSYVWGTSQASEPGMVQVDEAQYPFPVGANLSSALRHLRRAAEVVTLWVDAICIDQNNIAERGRQVVRMGQIYGQAAHVIIWLGEQTLDSTHALRTLEYLGAQIEMSQKKKRFRPPDAKQPDWYRVREPLPYDESTWSSITSLLSRPYFTRLWVLQEDKLAREATIYCGEASVPFSYFRRALLALEDRINKPLRMDSVSHRVDALADPKATLASDDIMYLGCNFHCKDPRDRIYGLMSLLPSSFSERLNPRYDIPVEEVFQEAFLQYCETTRRLDLLAHCGKTETHLARPSWVPDFSATPLHRQGLMAGPADAFTGATFHNVGEVLEVRGVFVDTIQYLSGPIPRHPSTLEARAFVNQHLSPHLCAGSYMSGYSKVEAAVRLLLHDQFAARYPSLDVSTLEHLIQQYVGLYSGQPEPESSFDDDELLGILYITHAAYATTTRHGCIGWIPSDSKRGDVVAVLLGCYTPLILRPNATDGTFTVLGQAYIQGLMDSEALLGPLPHGWRVQERETERYSVYEFVNPEDGEAVLEDPRLGDLPAEWQQVELYPDLEDPSKRGQWVHRQTGQVMCTDPRLLPHALEARGVDLRTIRLR